MPKQPWCIPKRMTCCGRTRKRRIAPRMACRCVSAPLMPHLFFATSNSDGESVLTLGTLLYRALCVTTRARTHGERQQQEQTHHGAKK